MADADIPDRQQENREKSGVALSSLLAASVLVLLKLIVGMPPTASASSPKPPIPAWTSGRRRDALGGPGLRPAGKPGIHLRPGKDRKPLRAALKPCSSWSPACGSSTRPIQRLVFKQRTEVDVNLWAFLVVMLSMAVDFSR